jgi:transcriptional regulator with XRE-family HTH domain
MDLGTRLAVVRRARRMKQKDVATAVDISQKHLSQLELGRASVLNLSSGVLLALANTLQVSTDYLLGRTDDAGIAALGFATVHPEASQDTPRASRRRRATPHPGAA